MAFDKIQYPTTSRNCRQARNNRDISHIDKVHVWESTANTISNGERLFPSERENKARMATFTTSLQHYIHGGPSLCNNTRGENGRKEGGGKKRKKKKGRIREREKS